MKSPIRCRWNGWFLLALVALTAAITTEATARDYDFCSTVVVRPDEYFRDRSTCANSFSDEEIAAGAEAVWLGDFTDVSHPVIPAAAEPCRPSPSHATNAPYVQRLAQRRSQVGGRPLWIVHMHRFELVPAVFAAQPGFRASHLLRMTRPWSDVLGFFANDRSASCLTTPCRWSDSWRGQEGKDTGSRLRDWIDRSGGANSYQSTVYYMARPDATNVFWATAAIADLRDPAYRAWRVAEAKEALAIGGYSVVDLNQKIGQYLFGPHSIGSTAFRDVSTLKARADTAWTAEPSGYRYPEYLAGLVALSRDLRSSGVPYSFTIALRAWIGDSFDDKTTPAVNEAAMVREIMTGAKVVFLDRPKVETAPGLAESAVADLASRGVAAIPIDQECGIAVENVTKLAPPSAPTLSR